MKKNSRWKNKNFRREHLKNWRKKHPDLVKNHYAEDGYRKSQRYATDPEYRKNILNKY